MCAVTRVLEMTASLLLRCYALACEENTVTSLWLFCHLFSDWLKAWLFCHAFSDWLKCSVEHGTYVVVHFVFKKIIFCFHKCRLRCGLVVF